MWDKIKDLFAPEAAPDSDDEASLHLAAAVLLIQVAKSDHSLDGVEIERMRQVLADEWGLEPDDLNDLVAVADDTSEADVSLHTQIDLINKNFSASRKMNLVRGLWQVACADGELHHYEELLIRRLADLLYVSHTDFIRAKHLALDEGD